MSLYALIVNDRHLDTEVRVFTTAELAIAAARLETSERGWWIEEEPIDGWLIHASHPTEGDHLQVVEVELEDA